VQEDAADDDAAALVVPAGFATPAVAEAWARRHGWHGVALDERRDLGSAELGSRVVGFLALRPADGEQLPPDRVRLLGLVRHELAIAFHAGQLREALAGEQALLAAILDGANEGILAVDERRRMVRLNRAAVSLLGGRVPAGAATCEAVLGCAQGDFLRCGPQCRFEEVLVGPKRLVDTELRLRAPDGTEIPVAASFSAMPGPEAGAVVVLRDLRAERAAEDLRASFLAAVSHELRTPLALISAYVDSLLDLGLDPAAQRRSVERIGLAAARLKQLVDELLELTQVEHASLALHRSRVEVGELLETVVGGLGEWPGMLPIHVDLPPDLPEVDVDDVRIGHVLVNLVDNARRYGGPGSIVIRARPQPGTVVISVEDDGPGIPLEERARVFDRLYRGRHARDAHPDGSGLGLHVCRRLVEAHGGRIWIEPDAERSAVSFSVPIALRRPAPDRDPA
jgi:signal transduction histidine kinase